MFVNLVVSGNTVKGAYVKYIALAVIFLYYFTAFALFMYYLAGGSLLKTLLLAVLNFLLLSLNLYLYTRSKDDGGIKGGV